MLSKILKTTYLERISKFLFFAFLILIFTETAEAHVKWFVEFDIAEQPLPIGEVIDKTFVYMFIVSVVACYLFFLVDRYIYEEGYFAEFDKKLKLFDGLANVIMRASAGIFFLSLFLSVFFHCLFVFFLFLFFLSSFILSLFS